MKKHLLLGALALVAIAPVTASVYYECSNTTPVTELVNNQAYYIYDKHGDDGTANEKNIENLVRYAFRWDNNGTVHGTHIKPVNAFAQDPYIALTDSHVWIAISSEVDGETVWSFKNAATSKYITGGTSDDAQATTTDEAGKGLFDVEGTSETHKVRTHGTTNMRWDAKDNANVPLIYWGGSGHDICFYEALAVDAHDIAVKYVNADGSEVATISTIERTSLPFTVPAEVGTATAAMVDGVKTYTVTLANGNKYFKWLSSKSMAPAASNTYNWVTTSGVYGKLTITNGLPSVGEWFVQVPAADGTIKIYSVNQNKFAGNPTGGNSKLVADGQPFEIRHTQQGPIALKGSSDSNFMNIQSPGIGPWYQTKTPTNLTLDAGSHWFFVFDESVFTVANVQTYWNSGSAVSDGGLVENSNNPWYWAQHQAIVASAAAEGNTDSTVIAKKAAIDALIAEAATLDCFGEGVNLAAKRTALETAATELNTAIANATVAVSINVAYNGETIGTNSWRVQPNNVVLPVLPEGFGSYAEYTTPVAEGDVFTCNVTTTDLFKFNNARTNNNTLSRWITSNESGLTYRQTTFAGADWFYLDGDCLYNVSNLKYVGAVVHSQQILLVDHKREATAFEVELTEFGPYVFKAGSLALNCFSNTYSNDHTALRGFNHTHTDGSNAYDATGAWFVVYDNAQYEANLAYFKTSAEENAAYAVSDRFSDKSLWCQAKANLQTKIDEARANIDNMDQSAEAQVMAVDDVVDPTTIPELIAAGNNLLTEAGAAEFGKDNIGDLVNRMNNLAATLNDKTTGIDEITVNDNNANVIYDLQGRRLAAPVKGINIINGKKVLVR